MKLQKPDEFRTWDLKDVSHAYGMSISTLRYRLQRMRIYPILYNGFYQYRLNQLDIDRVLEFIKRKGDTIPDVIYVTRESHFYESKSNFWSDKKIEKICAKVL